MRIEFDGKKSTVTVISHKEGIDIEASRFDGTSYDTLKLSRALAARLAEAINYALGDRR